MFVSSNPTATRTDAASQAENAKKEAARKGQDKDGFMKLLMSQMTHQDPMEPMSNQEMMQQMVTIESLDRTQKLETSIKSLNTNMFMSSANLIGRDVTVQDPDDTQKTITGKVEGLRVDNGTANLVINGKNYAASTMISVQ